MVVSFALMQELKDVLTISKFIIGTKVKCLESLFAEISNLVIFSSKKRMNSTYRARPWIMLCKANIKTPTKEKWKNKIRHNCSIYRNLLKLALARHFPV